jgi:hypothetical protein
VHQSYWLGELLLKTIHTRSQKCYASSNSLLQAGILQRVLDYVGPGHWNFISTVSRLWKDLHQSVRSERVEKVRCYDYCYGSYKFTCVPQMTLYSSIFASPSRVRLARRNGLDFLAATNCAFLAGWHADKATLISVRELGLQYTREVV